MAVFARMGMGSRQCAASSARCVAASVSENNVLTVFARSPSAFMHTLEPSAEMRLNLGIIIGRLERYEEAQEQFEQAHREDPSSTRATVSTIGMMPDGKHLFVSADGAGYIIEASSRTLVEATGTEVVGVMRDEP